MNVNLYVIEDYDNVTTFRPKKTNPIKACPDLAVALSVVEGAVEWANFRKAKMNLKSLAGKSGYTPYLPWRIFLL